MKDDTIVNLDLLFQRIELVQTKKVENGRLYLGGYSITYGRDGKEISRTENTWHGSLGYDEPEPRRSLWDVVLDLWGGRRPARTSMAGYSAMCAPGYEDRSNAGERP